MNVYFKDGNVATKNLTPGISVYGEELINGVMSNITTNLTKTELSGLMMQAPMMLTYDMVSGSIPLDGTYSNANIRGMAVLEVDFEANKSYIKKEIYGK